MTQNWIKNIKALLVVSALCLPGISFANGMDLSPVAPMTASSWGGVLDYAQDLNSYHHSKNPMIQPLPKARNHSEQKTVRQLRILDEVFSGAEVVGDGVINLMKCNHPACSGE